MPEPVIDVAGVEIELIHTVAFLVQQRRMRLESLAVKSHTGSGRAVTRECPVACLGLSKHAYNPLTRMYDGPKTVGDVLDLALRGELNDIRGLGSRRVGEILTALVAAGFTVDHGHTHAKP